MVKIMNDQVVVLNQKKTDEIDLIEILKVILSQKYLVLGVIFLFVLAALSYSCFATRVFQASSVLHPVTASHLVGLSSSKAYALTPSDALLKVKESLDSYDVRLRFFRENESLFNNLKLPSQTSDQKFAAFNRGLGFSGVQDSKQPEKIQIVFVYPEGLDGAGILNGFIGYAADVGREKVAGELMLAVENRLTVLSGKVDAARIAYKTKLEAKIAYLLEGDAIKRAQLKDELDALRLQLKIQRNDRVAQLAEAIKISNVLGIKRPNTSSSINDSERHDSAKVVRVDVSLQKSPLYFMGSEALEAERTVLQQRKSDDFTEVRVAQIAKELQLLQVNRKVEAMRRRGNEDIFLRDVAPDRAEISRLENLDLNLVEFKLVTIDQPAFQPISPTSPKTGFIILLSLVLGSIMGSIVALIRHFIIARLVVRN